MSQDNWYIDIYSDCDRSMGLEVGLAGTKLAVVLLVLIKEGLDYLPTVCTLIGRDR